MKKVIIVCALLAGVITAKAQSGASLDENTRSNSQTAIQHDNEYANTEISIDNRRVTFSDLPEMKKCTWAIVTDPDGTVMTQKRITPNDNSMDLHRLSKGEMYFLTLIYRNKSKKGFVLHL